MATTAAAEQIGPGPMTPLTFLVSDRRQETSDTWTLELEPVSGEGPSIAPGQFMMVYVFGVGEAPISVSGPPNRPGPVVLTVRAVGRVTEAVCASEPGSALGLRGPFGNSWPVDTAVGGDVVVVAGGIGLAPLRPVVLDVLGRRSAFGTVNLLYGARTPADLLYTAQLDEWKAAVEVAVTVDAAGTDWRGRVGVVPKLVESARFDPARTTAFVCGPEIMMHFTAQALLARGVAPERIMLSMERDMRCGVGHCGHCQLGPTLICRDGPVYSQRDLAPLLAVREL
jgi:anaerobic sulfite reductase subunit B